MSENIEKKINVEFYGTLLAWEAANSAITYDYKGNVGEALVELFHRHKKEYPSHERAVVKQIIEVAIRELKDMK